MKLRVLRQINRAVLSLGYLAFACKLLIPAGFMPAAIGDGWPIRLCGSGLPAGLFATADAHAGHGDHSDRAAHSDNAAQRDEAPAHDDLLWEHCPFGALSGAAALNGDFHYQVAFFQQEFSRATDVGFAVATRLFAFRPRAPPFLLGLLI